MQAVDEGAYLPAAGEWATAFHTRDVDNVAIEHNRRMAVTRWKRETLSCRILVKKVNEGRLHDGGGRDKLMLRPQLEGYFCTFGCWYFVATKKYTAASSILT